MLVEMSVIPVGGDTHSSGVLAKALEMVDKSGLPYQLTPSGTCIEGEWDEVMDLVRQCHECVRETRSHVVTLIKIEDDAGEHGKLSRNVASVEEKLGRSLGRDDGDVGNRGEQTPALLRWTVETRMGYTLAMPHMAQCIDDCLRCHGICLNYAMNHCLEKGGRHTEPRHFRLMIACSEMCEATANMMLINSPLHAQVCNVCADVCIACATSCEGLGGMEECVETCRRCAARCKEMAVAAV